MVYKLFYEYSLITIVFSIEEFQEYDINSVIPTMQ